MSRMSLRKFGRIVARVMETLPEAFSPFLDNLVIDIEREPDEQTLRDADFTDEEIEEGDTLYGLFIPAPIDGMDGEDSWHRIIIYKHPLEDDYPDRRELLLEIRKTVIHELAHHFGFNERDLDRFEEKDDPFGDELTDRLDEE